MIDRSRLGYAGSSWGVSQFILFSKSCNADIFAIATVLVLYSMEFKSGRKPLFDKSMGEKQVRSLIRLVRKRALQI